MVMHNASAPSVPGTPSHAVRPPSRMGSSAPPGTVDGSIRPTARTRPIVKVEQLDTAPDGVSPTDAYVRRFWIPILGPGAVADLLRLTAAAQSGRSLKLPVHTSVLAAHGLLRRLSHDRLGVAPTIPRLTPVNVRRLPPRIRRAHQRAERTGVATAEYPPRRGYTTRDRA